ncbi:MAG: prolyl oligopeptidase family serine peptidase [Burkholderiales bacterium]|nr:prolyl oligopeptidase family serine peptidase [Burkholderiales bacterium]
MVGDPKTQSEQFEAVSPLRRAAAIQAPALIAHGQYDGRVPIAHSEKLVAALKSNNKSVQWLQLDGEGHGVVKPENKQRYYQAVLDFLDKYIGGGQHAESNKP